ncbi:MAG: hypothetical protein ACHRXM_20080 [Isosphaerales bacterium]
MAKNHGPRQQKRMAKQKARRSAKRSILLRHSSNDPTIRLQRAEKWPVVQALAGARLWDEGIGYLTIARQESEGRLIFAVFLVDVYCLGVKDAFWRAGTHRDLDDLIRQMEERQRMCAITPACLAKIVKGAVAYAQSFGFAPHPDYRHASMLLEGIDPSTCPYQFTFGRDGKPFYMQGPYESLAQATAITQRVQDAGGHFLMAIPGGGEGDLSAIEGDFDELDSLDEDDFPDESP